VELLEERNLLSSWTEITTPQPLGTMMLLTNGVVLAEGSGVSNTWYKFKPDSFGNYATGTFTQAASSHVSRLYFASNVLKNGKVFVVGGEYSSRGSITNTGEIYDPVANTWTPITPFPLSGVFGDDPSSVLPNGKVLAGSIFTAKTEVYTPGTNSWAFAASKLNGDRSDEEAWTKLPGGKILSYDVFASSPSNVLAQYYNEATNTWVQTGAPTVLMSSSANGFELGPGFALPNGMAIQFGGNGHSSLYNPATNTWSAVPDTLDSSNVLKAMDDAPGAELPNGNILFVADSVLFNAPTEMFMYNTTSNTITQVPNSTLPTDLQNVLNSNPSYEGNMLMLPTGQVLYSPNRFGTSELFLYTPDGGPNSAWLPTITSVHNNGGGSYTVTGTQITGQSQGAAYGDDNEMDTSYPLVQLTNNSTNKVYYARTSHWSTTDIQTGSTPETFNFTLPTGIPRGTYTMKVIASGIASLGRTFNVPQNIGGPQLAPGETPAVFTGGHTQALPPLTGHEQMQLGGVSVGTQGTGGVTPVALAGTNGSSAPVVAAGHGSTPALVVTPPATTRTSGTTSSGPALILDTGTTASPAGKASQGQSAPAAVSDDGDTDVGAPAGAVGTSAQMVDVALSTSEDGSSLSDPALDLYFATRRSDG
jgi:hypothetical protein